MTKVRTRAQGRAVVGRLNKSFPDAKIDLQMRPGIAPDAEIAALRTELRREPNPQEFRVNPDAFQWMQPCNRRRCAENIEIAHGERFHWRTNRQDREQMLNLLHGAYGDISGHGTSNEVAAYRTFDINAEINALPFARGAFQEVDLGEDELPLMITPSTPKQEFAVRWFGRDGGARQDQWRGARNAETMDLNRAATDKIEYTLEDMYQSPNDVNYYDQINEQLRVSMELSIEDMALESLESNKMEEGIKDLITINKRVDPANVPDGNYLDLTDTTDYGPANVFTILRLKAILNHIAMWGFGFDPAGPITIMNMIMSPQNARDAWDYVDLVSGWNSTAAGILPVDPRLTVPTATREQIWQTGSLLSSAWGYNWQTQYNPRLSKGRLYVMTNMPVGWFFTKKSRDKILEWKDTPTNIEENFGQIMMIKTMSFVQPLLWAYRYLIVDF